MKAASLSLLAAITAVSLSIPAIPAASAETGRNCWMNIETGESGCYRSVDAMMRALGAGPASSGDSGLSDAEIERIQAATSTWALATVYDHDQYSIADGSYTFLASSGCDGDSGVEWEVGNVGATWNDRISSYQGYNGCDSALFEDANFGGSQYGPKFKSPNVGPAMNDKTTSIQWS